jgi:hypothetical protein
MIARSCNPSSDGSIRTAVQRSTPRVCLAWQRRTVIPSDIIIFDFAFANFVWT